MHRYCTSPSAVYLSILSALYLSVLSGSSLSIWALAPYGDSSADAPRQHLYAAASGSYSDRHHSHPNVQLERRHYFA